MLTVPRSAMTACLALVTSSGLAQSVLWDGDCNTPTEGVWEAQCGSSTNWDNDALPTSADTVVITGANVQIISTSARVIDALQLTDGALSGLLSMLAGGTATNSTMSGRFDAVAPLDFHGTTVFTGTVRGLASNHGDWTFNDGFLGDTFGDVEFDNHGTAHFWFEPAIDSGSVFRNHGVLEFANNGVVGFGLIINSGEVRKHTFPGLAVIGTRFEQTGGTTSVDTGTLRFASSIELTGGAMSVATGATLEFRAQNLSQEFDGLESISGQGDLTFDSGPGVGVSIWSPLELQMTAPGAARMFNNWNVNADVINRGDLRIERTRWAGGSGALVNDTGATALIVASSNSSFVTNRPIVNRGAFTSESEFGPEATPEILVTNQPSGTWHMNSPPNRWVRFLNRGDVHVFGSGLFHAVGLEGPFDMESGNVEVRTSDFILNAGGTWEGLNDMFISPPTFATANSTFTASGGTYAIPSGTTTIRTTNHDDTKVYLYGIGDGRPRFEVDGRLDLRSPVEPTADDAPISLGCIFTGSGSIVLDGDAGVTAHTTFGEPGDTATFRNNGRVRLLYDTDIGMTFENDGTCQQRTDVSVFGSPTISNAGDWLIESSDMSSTDSATFENTGLLIAASFETEPTEPQPESVMDIRLDNQGEVYVEDHHTLRCTDVAQVQDGILLGGTWIVEPLGRLVLPTSFVEIGPDATLVGAESGVPALTQVETIRGQLLANEDLTLEQNVLVTDGGRLVAGPQARINVEGTIEARRGSGETILTEVGRALVLTSRAPGDPCPAEPALVADMLLCDAALTPGPDDEILGLRIEAEVILEDDALLSIDVAGTSPCDGHDQVIVDGALEVGGVLDIDFVDEFVPTPGQTFTIVTASDGVTGDFSDVVSPVFGDNLRLTAIVGSNDVVLVTTCAADRNGDARTDIFDVVHYLAAFDAQAPSADLNTDGRFDIFDIITFLGIFDQGCG